MRGRENQPPTHRYSLTLPDTVPASFAALGLRDEVLRAVSDSGYTEPTPIQAAAIPHVLAGRDVIGVAQTGTGKTASFVLPILHKLAAGRARARMPRSIILSPTRELATQTAANFETYGKYLNLTMALIIGGVGMGDQEKLLDKGVDVLIATPGRLLDWFERGKVMLTHVQIIVIDEADRMLDMGFIPDIERICKLIPPRRQTLFFSATMPPEIQRLVSQFLNDPVKIEVAKPSTTSSTISQSLVACPNDPAEKREALRRAIRAENEFKNAIVFCNRKRDVGTLQRSLQKHGFNAVALHGDMDQRARMQALDQFKNGEAEILVASDVAARGLDIPAVSHVFNFDVPIHAEDYVHRIGRTGRAGRSGTAVTLVAPSDKRYLAAIEKITGQTIPWQNGALPESAPEEGPARGEREGARRRRGGERSRAERREAPQKAAAAEAPRRKDDKPARTKDSRPRRREDDDGPTPVGLGDHIPQFLLRPVRLKNA